MILGVKVEREQDARKQWSVAQKGGTDKEGLGWARIGVALSTRIFN